MEVIRQLKLECIAVPRVNRSEICNPDQIQVFHLINRCVRKTFLCGKDRKSGRDYSHRKEWIRQRLEELAGIFAVEILGFAVLSNHLHVVVRTRPDIAKQWSSDEISLRWLHLFPQRRNADSSPATPTEEELNAIRNNTAGVQEKKDDWLTFRGLCDAWQSQLPDAETKTTTLRVDSGPVVSKLRFCLMKPLSPPAWPMST